MLFEEAKFIGDVMYKLRPEDVFPLCNLGSSDEDLAKHGSLGLMNISSNPLEKKDTK